MPPKPVAPAGSAKGSTSKAPAKPALKKAPAVNTKPPAASSTKKLTELEKQIYEIGKQQNDLALTQEVLLEALRTDVISDAMKDSIQSLCKKRLFLAYQTKDGSPMWRVQRPEEAKSASKISDETNSVLDLIRQAGDKGIWSKTVKAKSGLHQSIINKCISQLEGMKSIKNVKSVKYPTRKIYMLEGIAPSIELTGGPWYSDSDLDTEFVETASKLCHRYVMELSAGEGSTDRFLPLGNTPFLPTAHDVAKLVKASKIIQVELTPQHIEVILRLLVFDGDLQEIRVTRQAGDYDEEDEGTSKKRKRANGSTRKGKRVKMEGEPDSDAIDQESEDGDAAYREDEDDDDELPPPLDDNATSIKNYKHRPGPPGRSKHYYVYRALSHPVWQHPLRIGITDTPCGVCPVRSECDNREKPSMPERSLADVDSLVGVGVTVQKKTKRADEDDEALIRMKPPNGMFEPPKLWMGGGTRGKQRVGVVNPRECDYYKTWLSY